MKHPTFLLAFCLTLYSTAAAAARDLTVEDTLRAEAIGSVALHERTNTVYFERIKSAHERSSQRSPYISSSWLQAAGATLFVSPLDGSVPPTPVFPQNDGAGYNILRRTPFSPDGRRLAFFKVRDETIQLGVHDIHTRRTKLFRFSALYTRCCDGPLFDWINDESFIAVARDPDAISTNDTVAGLTRAKRLQQEWRERAWANGASTGIAVGAGRYLTLMDNRPKDRLIIVDARSGRTRDLDERAFSISSRITVSADGRYAAVLSDGPAMPAKPDERYGLSTLPNFEHRLTVYDLSSGEATDIEAPGYRPLADILSWSPDGENLLFFASPKRGDKADGSVFVYNTIDHAYRKLAPPPAFSGGRYENRRREPQQIPEAQWAGDHVLVRTSLETGERVWVSVSPNEEIQIRSAPDATSGEAAFRRAGGVVPAKNTRLLTATEMGAVYTEHSPGEPSRLIAMRAGGEPHSILAYNPHFAGIDASAEPVLIRHKGWDGVVLTSWLFLPPGANASVRRAYPLVVLPYGERVFDNTPPPTFSEAAIRRTSAASAASPQLLAARGYAVLLPSLPLGWAPEETAAKIVQPVMTAVDEAIAMGWTDPARMAVMGHSYGGYSALAIAAATDRFRAIIAASASSNLTSAYSEQRPGQDFFINYPLTYNTGFHELGQFRMGSPPWTDTERYIRNSPLFHAENIITPILLLQGDLDYIHASQGQEMFTALARQGKDVVFVRYAGEGHGIHRPANIRDMWGRIFGFLEENGVTPEANFKL